MRTPPEIAQLALAQAAQAKNNQESGQAIVTAIVALCGEVSALRRTVEQAVATGIQITMRHVGGIDTDVLSHEGWEPP